MSICVEDAAGSPDALQPDRLPHEKDFIVVSGTGGSPRTRSASWVDDDQVARQGGVNCTLDGARGEDVLRCLAADRDGHGVDRLFAAGGRDDQLTALRGCGARRVLCL